MPRLELHPTGFRTPSPLAGGRMEDRDGERGARGGMARG